MRRHERPKQANTRVKLPFGKDYADLSIAERRTLILFQLKQLGPPSKQQRVTCLCGKDVPVMFAYRCYECGVHFCPKCASGHFDTNRGNYIGLEKGKAGKGKRAGQVMGKAIINFLHLMYQKDTAARVLCALIEGLKKARKDFQR